MRIRRYRELLGVLAILVAGGMVSAVVLMEQIQPAVPVASQLTANCTPRTVPSPTNVTIGTSGSITFSCNSDAPTLFPAFTTTGPVAATPTITGFGAPYNLTHLYIYDADGSPSSGWCYQRAGGIKITEGVRVTITANGWNYCADFENVGPGGLPEFTVTWST